jgi:IS1 family transposase
MFWGNSSNSKQIFTLQKKIIRIMVGAQPRTPCRSLFKKLEILPVPCQYIFSLMNFILNNQEHFQTNSSIHSIDTSNMHHLHRPNANLSCFQKSTFYAGITIFNRLPLSLTSLKNEKTKFKAALRKYLNTHSSYLLDEFFMYKDGS